MKYVHDNVHTLDAVNALSPNSRASLRQATLNGKQAAAESTRTSPTSATVKNRGHSKGMKKSPNTNKAKRGYTSAEVDAVVVMASKLVNNIPPTKNVNMEETVTTHLPKPKRYPDYSGCVVSYTCPESERPGHGIVGKCNHAEGTYEVQFTFADNEKPQGKLTRVCPYNLWKNTWWTMKLRSLGLLQLPNTC